MREVLQCERGNLSGGNNPAFKKNTGEKRFVTGEIIIII
jgi:hypothetical protein